MNLPILNDTIDCSCNDCISACKAKPGWFLPEEIKPAADLLGLTEKEFFEKYLSVDYYHLEKSFLFVLSPATSNSVPGEEFPFEPGGRCTFLTEDEKCSIHSAKPYECKSYDHRDKYKDVNLHLAVAQAWVKHKDYIANLLGREPEISPPNPMEIIAHLLGRLKSFSNE